MVSDRIAMQWAYLISGMCHAEPAGCHLAPCRKGKLLLNKINIAYLGFVCITAHQCTELHISESLICYFFLLTASYYLRTCLPVHTRNAYRSKLSLIERRSKNIMLLNFLICIFYFGYDRQVQPYR